MIYLITLLCSLIIQFASVEYPIDYTQTCADFFSLYTTVWENVVARGYSVNPDYGILVDRNGSDANGSSSLAFYTPAEPFNQSASSVNVSLRDDTTVSLNCVNWYRWLVNADGSIASGPTVSNISKAGFYIDGVYTWSNHNTIIYNSYYDLPYGNTSTFNWVTEQPVPVGIGFGSLGSGGHSSGGSPIDSLNNNGVTWSTPSFTFHSNGHSVGVSSSSATFDFSNAFQNLLGQLVDNANDIIVNLSGIGSILGGMSNNIIQGASAIFNGISAFNNNVNGFLEYLTEIPSSSDIVDALQGEENIGALYDLSQQIDIFSEIGLTQVNSAPTYTFNFSGTMFDYVNNITLDFSFLDSTKSIWQTLLIALLYFNLLVTILVGLPDLIQGRGET